jgi:hypothetical protein
MTRDQREIHRKKERSFENSKCSMLQPRLNRSMSFELPSTPPEEDRADRRTGRPHAQAEQAHPRHLIDQRSTAGRHEQ